MHLAHLRVIVVADRVLVFDPVHPKVETFVAKLEKKLNEVHHPMPFEFRAVEAVLVEVCSSFAERCGNLIPAVDLVLDKLSTTKDFGGGTVSGCMDRLLPLENALNEFRGRVAQTRQAVNEVLASDVR